MSEVRSIFQAEAAHEEEQLYFKMIDSVLKDQENKIISNGKPAHAVYLIHKFLANAEKKVRIYTGRLSQTFNGVQAYADPVIANSAIGFLRKENSELSIIIADDPDVPDGKPIEAHPLLSAIGDADIKGSIKVWKGKPSDWEEFRYHFIVMDDHALRIEVDTEKAEAFVNFSDPKFALQLSRRFSYLKNNSNHLVTIPNAA